MTHLLTLDVGNSNVKIGIFRGEELIHHWRVATHAQATSDELGIQLLTLLHAANLSAKDVYGVSVSCVVPTLRPYVVTMVETYFKSAPFCIEPGVRTGMPIRVDNPREVGNDRIAAAVAAMAIYGAPVIVVDCGTATTLSVIDGKGAFLGGVIAPGLATALDGLYRNAALLPRIELLAPERVIGRTTVASMQSGAIYGFRGMLASFVEQMQVELGERASVIATGGHARFIEAGSTCTWLQAIRPDLTLQGLKMLWDINRGAITE